MHYDISRCGSQRKLYCWGSARYRLGMVSFTRRPDGIYRARIGAIEVLLEQHGYFMHLWEPVFRIPCDYGPCPEGCREEWRGTDDCPHEYTEPDITHSIGGVWCKDRREAVEDAKAQLRRQQGCRNSWPAEEAARFLNEPWTYKREDSET